MTPSAAQPLRPAIPKPGALVDQYKILVDLVKLEHTRWVDNYRIFLTVAGAVLAGEGLILAKSSLTPGLQVFLVALAVFGAVVALAGWVFVERPRQQADFWYALLRQLEQADSVDGAPMLAPIFTLANDRLSRDVVGFSDGQPIGKRVRWKGAVTQVAVAICLVFEIIQLGTIVYAFLP